MPLTRLPIVALSPSQSQPRMSFDDASLEELAASIRSQGIVQPLLVRPCKTSTATIYEIVAGERRWRAARLAGLDEVPVFVREMSDEEALVAALIENLQREDLNPMEEAMALRNLRDTLRLSQEELADRVGKSRSSLANSLRLLQLPQKMQQALSEGTLSPGHGRALLALPDEEAQNQLFAAILERQLSVRDTEEAVNHWKRHGSFPVAVTSAAQPRVKRARADRPEAIKTMIRVLRASVNPKAVITGTEQIGRISLPYASPQELAALLSRLGVDADGLASELAQSSTGEHGEAESVAPASDLAENQPEMLEDQDA